MSYIDFNLRFRKLEEMSEGSSRYMVSAEGKIRGEATVQFPFSDEELKSRVAQINRTLEQTRSDLRFASFDPPGPDQTEELVTEDPTFQLILLNRTVICL